MFYICMILINNTKVKEVLVGKKYQSKIKTRPIGLKRRNNNRTKLENIDQTELLWYRLFGIYNKKRVF